MGIEHVVVEVDQLFLAARPVPVQLIKAQVQASLGILRSH